MIWSSTSSAIALSLSVLAHGPAHPASTRISPNGDGDRFPNYPFGTTSSSGILGRNERLRKDNTHFGGTKVAEDEFPSLSSIVRRPPTPPLWVLMVVLLLVQKMEGHMNYLLFCLNHISLIMLEQRLQIFALGLLLSIIYLLICLNHSMLLLIQSTLGLRSQWKVLSFTSVIYFGDHLFSDLRGLSKAGWRTTAIIHELEVASTARIASPLSNVFGYVSHDATVSAVRQALRFDIKNLVWEKDVSSIFVSVSRLSRLFCNSSPSPVSLTCMTRITNFSIADIQIKSAPTKQDDQYLGGDGIRRGGGTCKKGLWHGYLDLDARRGGFQC